LKKLTASDVLLTALSALTYGAYTRFFVKNSSGLYYTSTLISCTQHKYLNCLIVKKICRVNTGGAFEYS